MRGYCIYRRNFDSDNLAMYTGKTNSKSTKDEGSTNTTTSPNSTKKIAMPPVTPLQHQNSGTGVDLSSQNNNTSKSASPPPPSLKPTTSLDIIRAMLINMSR